MRSTPATPDRLEARVAAARRRLRLQVAATGASAVVAVAAMVLLIAWLAGGAPWWLQPSALPLVLLVAAAGAAGVLTGFALRQARRLTEVSVATAAEARLGLADGRLRGGLELDRAVPPGASAALARREVDALARRVALATPLDLAGELGRAGARSLRRVSVFAATAVFSALLLGFAAPERAAQAWASLGSPLEHLTPPALPPLRVTPGDTAVARGADVELAVEAEGRPAVTLHWRSRGDVARARPVTVEDGRATARLERVDAEVTYWITSRDGASTPRYRVEPVDPLFVSGLELEVRYPAYLGRPAERMGGDIPPLEIPAGTELRMSGRGNRPLARAALTDRATGERVPLRVRDDRFAAAWTPAADALLEWELEGRVGGEVMQPAPLELRVVPDRPPVVELVFPGTDTVFGPDMRQPLLIDAADDHGLTAASLVSWRVNPWGEADSAVVEAIAVPGQPDRVLLRPVLEAAARRLLPGDALHYQVRVTDNAPARQVGTSGTFVLRLPTMAELRQEALALSGSALDDAERLARAARELERAARELARRRGTAGRAPHSPASPGRPPDEAAGLDFRSAEDVRQLLDRQEALIQELEALQRRTDALDRAMEAAGLRDAELQRRLEELRTLMEDALSPELRRKLEEARGSLDALDAEQVQQALQQLAEHQEEFRQRLEQTLELMRRAAAEQKMAALADASEDLAAQQRALAEALREEGAARQRAGQQAGMAEEAQALTGAMQALERQLAEAGEAAAAARTGEAAAHGDQARAAMERAADRAEAGEGSEAAEAAEAGAAEMQAAAQSLRDTRDQMTQAWRSEVQQTVQQATEDALALAQQQEQLLQQMLEHQRQQGEPGSEQNNAPMSAMRSDQGAIQQGVQQMGRNLADASQRSAMISRDVGGSLGRAMMNMQDALEALQGKDGSPRIPAPEAARALDALNQLAMALLENADRIANASAGTGLQQMLEELAELAREQGGLNGRTNSLLPLELGPEAMAEQLRQLARQQTEIGRRLGGMNRGGADDPEGRLGDLGEEAERLAQEMAGGRLTPEILERQQRLFHRLLDAGRTLERDEFTDEHVAGRPATAVRDHRRMDLRELDGAARYPPPTEEELRALPPAYRRLILEYFDRLNRADPEAPK
jgi:hypothetical protein